MAAPEFFVGYLLFALLFFGDRVGRQANGECTLTRILIGINKGSAYFERT